MFFNTERYDKLHTALTEFLTDTPDVDAAVALCIHVLQMARPQRAARRLVDEDWLRIVPMMGFDLRITNAGGWLISTPLTSIMPPLYNPDGELVRILIEGHRDFDGEWIAPRAYRLRAESLPLPPDVEIKPRP